MAQVLIDQFHLSFFVPRSLPDRQEQDIQATLDNRAFQAMLLRAIRACLQNYKALANVRFSLTR